ncbi:hypothetical protein PIB19_14955 [Sphingomonas sp. 7/4-4]|uniref:hypothetical protein n=1 Tax=Sphingomonas sp. 7/4-4 TaxID=3018446 RepID=UPI0022F3998F|nr:hypothetical protein [Sphingomonas sp. 7/4-4]WBY06804.1 hypothetical protein PIB19_14955 [Sphingomonas sp. 7/4-4]
MRIFLIAIAMAAFASDLAAIGALMRPPIILAIEVAFVLGWAAIHWRNRQILKPPWVNWATGLVTIFGPLRWALFNWCLLVERCVA